MQMTKTVEWVLWLAALAMFGFAHWIFGTHFPYAEATKQAWGLVFLAAATLIFLFCRDARRADARLLLLALPLALTLPGWLVTEGRWAYHFSYELANTLIALLWLWLFYAVAGQRFAVKTTAVLVAGLAVTVGYSLVQWIGLGMEAPPATNFGNQNYAANFIVLAAPLLLAAAYLRVGNRLWPWVISFVVTVLVLAVALKTRAALAGFVVALYLTAGLVLWGHARRRLWLWIWAALPLATLAAIYTLWLYRDALPQDIRFLQLFDPHAWYPRLLPYLIGWHSVLDSLWIGHGAGSSHALFQVFERSVPEASAVLPQVDYKHIHSEYLEWLQDGGMLALAGYLGVWGWLSIKAIRLFMDERRDHETRWVALAAFAGLLAFHLHSLFEVSARMPANRLGLFMMAGLLLALDRPTGDRVSGGRAGGVAQKAVPLAMAALLAWSLSVELPRQHDAFEAHFFPEQIGLSADKRHHIEQTSDSVPAIYERLGYRLFVLKNPVGAEALMDRLHTLMPGIAELEFMRLYHYMLANQKTGFDRGEIARLIRDVRADKRYNPKTTHFMLQFAAQMNDPELFLEVLEDRLHMMSLTYKIRKIGHRDSTLVRVDPSGSGFLFVYSNQKAGFILGLPQLELLMAIARETHSRKDAAALVSAVPSRIRLLHPVHPQLRTAIDALVQDFLGPGMSMLAEPPNI